MKSTRVARFACRCALWIRKPAPSWKIHARPVKRANVANVAHAVKAAVAVDVAKAAAIAAHVVTAVRTVVHAAKAVATVAHAKIVQMAETKATTAGAIPIMCQRS